MVARVKYNTESFWFGGLFSSLTWEARRGLGDGQICEESSEPGSLEKTMH